MFGEFSTVWYSFMVDRWTAGLECEFSVMAGVKQQTEGERSRCEQHTTTMEEQEIGVKEDRHETYAIQKQGGSAALNNRCQREGVSVCKSEKGRSRV